MGADRLVAAYIEGLNLMAVWLARLPDGSVRAGHSQEPGRSVARLEGAVMLAELWCAKPMHAQVIADAAAGAGAADLAALRDIATGFGVSAATLDEVATIALAAVAAIEIELARAKTAGDLRPLNRTYKRLRQESDAAGRSSQKYPSWFFEWKRSLVGKVAAQAVRSPDGPFGYQIKLDLSGFMAKPKPIPPRSLMISPQRLSAGRRHHVGHLPDSLRTKSGQV